MRLTIRIEFPALDRFVDHLETQSQTAATITALAKRLKTSNDALRGAITSNTQENHHE